MIVGGAVPDALSLAGQFFDMPGMSDLTVSLFGPYGPRALSVIGVITMLARLRSLRRRDC